MNDKVAHALKHVLTEPLIFQDAWDSLDLDGVDSLMSLNGLKSIESEDMVGVNLANHCSDSIGLPFQEAIRRISSEGGYITGWEYHAGDQGVRFAQSTEQMDKMINRRSWLYQMALKGVPMFLDLDLVMRWVFISYGRGLDSTWHVDPIGSCAWMLMLVGEKKWTIKRKDGSVWEHILKPGELLLLPPGLDHKVENIGDGLNVGISHNWIDVDCLDPLWEVLSVGLCKLVEYIESHGKQDFYGVLELFREEAFVDNLMFGLIMILIHSSEDKLAYILPTGESDHTHNSIRYYVSLVRRFKASASHI